MAATLDPQKLLGDAVRFGTIDAVDLDAATCRVRVGDIVTGDIPWLAGRAGGTSIWSPPTIGEQCILLCADGDEAAGIAILGLFSTANPAPSASDRDLVLFADTAELGYDSAAHAFHLTLPGAGRLRIVAPGGVTIEAPVTIKGKLTVEDDVAVTGKVTATDDVVGDGKSLKGHRHLGVTAGGAVSGIPQ